jgi:hypothetical protein
MDFPIEVNGVAEALANIKNYQIIKRQACVDTLKAVAFEIATTAKYAAPVLTGRLRASISVNWSGSAMDRGQVDSKANPEDGVGQPGGEPGMVDVIGTNLVYAARREFGFVGVDSLGRHYNEQGFSYLYQAYFAHESEVADKLGKVLGEDIR